MNKTLATTGLILLATAGPALASGYRIPEQSLNSTARAGSYVAYTPGADAAFFNPANMSWLENRWTLEADATWIHLSSIAYTDTVASRSGDTENENFFMPTFFAVSPDYNNFRFGFSVTAPAGLSKRWEDWYPKSFAEEFTLKVFDLNPTISYRFNDRFSVGVGIQAVYTDGKVKSNGLGMTRDLEGDSWDMGYNFAATFKPTDKSNLSITYRSEVDLTVEGNATLTGVPSGPYSGYAEVEIPLPAVLAIAASYTFFDQLTFEIEYDRNFWSDYKKLDFNYAVNFGNHPYDGPVSKNWDDSNAWRISISYDMKNNFTLMAGFAIDENPIPDSTLGFELPDSDALLYSLGVRYKINENMEMGVAYLYDDKESRSADNRIVLGSGQVEGTFEDAAAHLVTFGFTYKM